MPKSRQSCALLGAFLAASTIGTGASFASQTVHVDLRETDSGGMAITASADTIQAGETNFDVANDSKATQHEFLIAKLTTSLDKVPYDEKNGRIDESKLDGFTELGDLKAGNSGSMTLNLSAGKYLLFCNLPGHFKSGMYDVLTVTN